MSRHDRRNRSALAEWGLGGPAVLWFVSAAVSVMAGIAGYGVFAAPHDVTLSEAAALRDGAGVIRLIGAGADPDEPARIRGGIIRERESVLTPLEAATVTRRPEIVRLLVAEGATLDETNFPVLFCLAAESDFDEVVAALKELAPSHAAPPCDSVRLPRLS